MGAFSFPPECPDEPVGHSPSPSPAGWPARPTVLRVCNCQVKHGGLVYHPEERCHGGVFCGCLRAPACLTERPDGVTLCPSRSDVHSTIPPGRCGAEEASAEPDGLPLDVRSPCVLPGRPRHSKFARRKSSMTEDIVIEPMAEDFLPAGPIEEQSLCPPDS